MARKKFRLAENVKNLSGEIYAEKDQIFYEFNGHDYGLARDDTNGTGRVHVSVSESEDGGFPFCSVPADLLEEIKENAPAED